MPLPKISIVTPSYNQGQFLEQTIQSIINQGYPNLEYIIIDGGSTDNSIEVIQKYAHHLKYWVSEKDRGQAHAINKGLKHCSGEIFNWINSDDYLAENALSDVAKRFTEGVDIVAGAVIDFNEDGEQKKIVNRSLAVNEYLKVDVALVYHQPAVWLRMRNMKAVGVFNEDLHFCFDQEYMMRYLLNYKKVEYTDNVLAYFRLHKNSKSVARAEHFAWDFRQMYQNFWLSQKGSDLERTAKRKFLDYEWPLLNNTINKADRSRFSNFLLAVKAMMHDPQSRISKKSLGWLKHILLGNKNGLSK